jgi:hypothetical protein
MKGRGVQVIKKSCNESVSNSTTTNMKDNNVGDILETPCKKALKMIQIMRLFGIAESLSIALLSLPILTLEL